MLVDCLQQSPSDIVTQLTPSPSSVFAQGDIKYLSNTIYDDHKKAERIVTIVMKQVKNNFLMYRTFITALKNAGDWTKLAVKELEQTYASFIASSNENVAGPSPALNPHLSRSRPDRSLYDAFEKMPTVHDCCTNERTLELQTIKIVEKFATLQMIVIKSIEEHKVSVKRIFTFLGSMKAATAVSGEESLLFSSEHLQTIENECRDVDALFRVLDSHYYSWFNFDLIENIINAFCKEDAQVCIELSQYKVHLRQYCENRLCQIPESPDIFGKLRDHAKPYVFETDRDWSNMRLSELQTIKTTICDILKLNKAALFLRAVSSGCVKLNFDLPDHVVVPLSFPQLEKLQIQGIRFVGKSLTACHI